MPTLPSEAPKATVKDHWLHLDDQKTFRKIIHYPAIYDDKMRMQRLRDVAVIRQAGFDTLHCPVMLENYGTPGPNIDEMLLDALYRCNMRAIIAPNGPRKAEIYGKFANHPATIGLAPHDDVHTRTPEETRNAYDSLKATYPHLAIYGSGGTDERMLKHVGHFDLVGFQRYTYVTDDGFKCVESMASTTSNVLDVFTAHMRANCVVMFNPQLFRWYDFKEWIDPETGEKKRIGNPTYPRPKPPTEEHYRIQTYQSLILGCASLSAYAWADWTKGPNGPTPETNLSANTPAGMRLAATRVNGEITTMLPFLMYGERFPLLMPSESYAAAWLYQGRLLVLAVNGRASAGVIGTRVVPVTNEVPFVMKPDSKRVLFQHVPGSSLTVQDKALTFVGLQWNASEAYIIDLVN